MALPLLIAVALALLFSPPLACAQDCPAAFCLLLENSSSPASLIECARARPDLGKPSFTISHRARTGEPWYWRTCFWKETHHVAKILPRVHQYVGWHRDCSAPLFVGCIPPANPALLDSNLIGKRRSWTTP